MTASRVFGWHFWGSYLSAELWKAPGAITLASLCIPVAFRTLWWNRISQYLPVDSLIVGKCVWAWKTPRSPIVTKLPPVISVLLLENSCWGLVSTRRFAIEVGGWCRGRLRTGSTPHFVYLASLKVHTCKYHSLSTASIKYPGSESSEPSTSAVGQYLEMAIAGKEHLEDPEHD